jgi:chemotaxis protein MotA
MSMKYVKYIMVTLIVFLFALTIFNDIGFGMIFNPDAMIIIFGGTIVAVLIGFPLKRIQLAMADVINAFRDKRDRDTVIGEVLEIARIYRRADIRGLEKKMEHMGDDFLKIGVSLLINNHQSERMRNIMDREMTNRIIQFHFSENLLKTIARLTPSFGLVGTVISLIKMFNNVHSFDMITPTMAVALMSTFYGVIISNLIMMPLSAKIKDHAISYEALASVITEGIIATNNTEHPLRIEEGLRGYHQRNDISTSGIETVSALHESALKV